jgi:hypothetical protein
MRILHINSEKDVGKINKLIKQGKDVFALIYMDGCGPCNATRPEWAKLGSALRDQYKHNDKLVVVDINKNVASKVFNLGTVDGFPTMKYISNFGKLKEPYENSAIQNKDRSVNSFINWIESKVNKMVSTTPVMNATRLYRRMKNAMHTRNNPKHNKSSRHMNSRRIIYKRPTKTRKRRRYL